MNDDPDVIRETYLVCHPVADDPVERIPGSTQVPCNRCRQAVWLSPSSAPILAQTPYLICSTCAEGLEAETRAEGGEVRHHDPLPGQQAEIRAALRAQAEGGQP